MRVVGVLTSGHGAKNLARLMAELGWMEGRDIRYDARHVAQDSPDTDATAQELVRAGPDLLAATGVQYVLALQRATKTIPIVCGGIADPVGSGIARSLAQPGMNVTGLSFGLPEAAVLQVGTLKALVPSLKHLVFLTAEADNPGDRPAPAHEAAARAAGLTSELARVRTGAELERALDAMRRPDSEAAWFALYPRDVGAADVARAAAQRRLASHARSFEDVRAGILTSHWLVHSEPLRRVAIIADKILRGEPPGRIPFELPDKTQFAINLSTAKSLRLRVPEEILLRATDVVG